MRTGPHPLTAHLSLAAQSYALNSDGGSVSDGVVQMLEGVKKYQSYGALPFKEPLRCIFQVGSLRLLTNAGGEQLGRPLLLVPSLINSYQVFDLHRDCSFVRWLGAQGVDVYVIDWGDLCADEGAADLDAVVVDRLLAAVKYVAELYEMPVDVLGYCMGGTLLAGAASYRPDFFHSLVFLAAPWDFDCAGDHMVQQLRLWAPGAMPSIASQGVLTSSLVQGLFATLYPEQALHKFSRFLHMDAGTLEEELFVAVEDWLNDGVDLPQDIALSCIRDWYGKNVTARGAWSVLGVNVAPEKLNIPAYVVASEKDRLVDVRSAKALADVLPKVEFYDPDCGHIGMMAGHDVIESVWQPIRAWLET